MGIRVDPVSDPYGDDCLHCYDADETPQILYVVFKGINIGDLWSLRDPTPPSPPNRVFMLTQDNVNPCLWTYIGDEWGISYRAHNPGGIPHSSLAAGTIGFIPQLFGFTQAYDPTCIHQFNSDLAGPANIDFYGGSAWVFRLTI